MVQGEGRTERVPYARPIGFSPDGRRLVLARAPEGVVEGLEVLALVAGAQPTRITNQGVLQAPGPLPESHVPCPVDTGVSWLGTHLIYAVPGDGPFDVDIETGEVRRGPS